MGIVALAASVGCHLIGGAGDLDFEAQATSTGGYGGSAGAGGAGGGAAGAGGLGGEGGGGGGGAGGSAVSTCGDDTVDVGELCFGEPLINFDASNEPLLDMVLVDCDEDNDLDVIVSGAPSHLYVLKNDGEGHLGVATATDTGLPTPAYIALGDFDGGDAPLELYAAATAPIGSNLFRVYSLEGCNISLITGWNGSGVPSDLITVQFSGDWVFDPVAPVNGPKSNLSYYDTTEPLVESLMLDAVDLRGVAAGRLFAGDNYDDIAYIDHPAAGQAELLLANNEGVELEDAGVRPLSAGAVALAIADVDGVNLSDIVVAAIGDENTTHDNVTVLLNSGTGSFIPQQPILVQPGDVFAGDPIDVILVDMDGDQHQDIVTANNADNVNAQSSVSVFVNDGAGNFQLATELVSPSFEPSSPLEVGRKPVKVLVAHMNADGALDIVTAGAFLNQGKSQVTVRLANP